GHGVAFLREQRDRRLRQERFRDRQHPVEVENHSSQVGVFHARAIVFDLDGVLVDTMHVIRAAWAGWATDRGLAADEVLASIHMIATELIDQFAPLADPVAEMRAIALRQSTLERSVAAFEGA